MQKILKSQFDFGLQLHLICKADEEKKRKQRKNEFKKERIVFVTKNRQ